MERKRIDTGTLYRHFELDRASIDEEARTAALAFSSEQPVERWWGVEILDHSPSSVRLGRLADGGPVLVDHDPSDHVAVVEQVSIDADRKGRAVVRFGKGARASEIWQDVVDGIRRHVSVGYRIHKMTLESEEDGVGTYRATDWEPLEVSIVSVPADPTVGIGRAEDHHFVTTVEVIDMPDKAQRTDNRAPEPQPAPQPAQAAPAIDLDAEREKARRSELARIQDIETLAEQFNMRELGREHIAKGTSLDEFRCVLLERIGNAKPAAAGDLDVGLTDKEARQFSFLRAINALANPSDRRAQEAAAFEFEVSRAAAEKRGRAARGILVPPEVLRLSEKRDLTVGTATAGGHLVATELLSESFIELLRNRMVVASRATTLTDLTGNIAIPRQTGGATAYWVAESGAPTESQQAFDQVTLSPNTVGAFTDFSRKLMLQASMDVEAFVRGDLATVLALEIDRVAIAGSGSGAEPTGILNTTGIGDVAGGTNGAAPTWAHIVELESDVAAANADVGSLYYVTNAKVRGKLKQTEKASGTAQFVWEGNEVNGYQALVTNQVPSNLTKGTGTNLSAIIFGNLADLLVGMWGGLDITVDPYTSSTSGTVRVVALQDVDIAVRHAESFSAMQDAITT